jgi:hypothetical protein
VKGTESRLSHSTNTEKYRVGQGDGGPSTELPYTVQCDVVRACGKRNAVPCCYNLRGSTCAAAAHLRQEKRVNNVRDVLLRTIIYFGSSQGPPPSHSTEREKYVTAV